MAKEPGYEKWRPNDMTRHPPLLVAYEIRCGPGVESVVLDKIESFVENTIEDIEYLDHSHFRGLRRRWAQKDSGAT